LFESSIAPFLADVNGKIKLGEANYNSIGSLTDMLLASNCLVIIIAKGSALQCFKIPVSPSAKEKGVPSELISGQDSFVCI
jgi:hypothetical protein